MDAIELAENIKLHYYQRLEELPRSYQEHFLTRMLAASGDEKTKHLLRNFKSYWIGENVKETFHGFKNLQPNQLNQFFTLRESYFEKFPLLFGADWGLTRLRRLNDVLGLDYREEFFEVFDRDQLLDMVESIMADDDAIRTLSTYAITTPMMLSELLYGDFRLIDFGKIYRAGLHYDLSEQRSLLLLCYLYTHCIVYASFLYTKEISLEYFPTFHRMLSALDEIITNNFVDITIDVKLETIVCAKMCHYDLTFESLAIEECMSSIKSIDEPYIVDPRKKKNFAGAEHTNALFVLAVQKYQPHPVRI
jgi:hypothetical protein